MQRKGIAVLALLALAGCASPLTRGKRDYRDAMTRLPADPITARDEFAGAEAQLGEALADPDLKLSERVLAISLRVRSLIELDRHGEAGDAATAKPQGYDPEVLFPGDPVGLSLMRASALDPERAYAELLLLEKEAPTLRTRLHAAWAQVHVLGRIGTPKARAEAVRICDQHAGKIDFDALKKGLAGN